uniref:hypothetical protein n=1 Tax=Fuscoporia viticola TaxID=139386 RepID=UPI0023AB2F7D|nr:hypothetical protein P1Q19_mgp04 [Fuscoporia viticola]WCF76829.1 hypothetical protein [Fuscoporia viticola]
MFKHKLIKQMIRLIILFLSNDYLVILTSAFVSFLFWTFIADGFKLSDNKIIKNLQKYTLILSLLIAFLLLFTFITILFNVFFNPLLIINPTLSVEASYDSLVLFSETNNTGASANSNPSASGNVSITGNIILSKESATELAKGAASAASNVGLGASISGMSVAMVQVLKNSALPISVKAGGVIGAGAAGAAIHVAATTANKVIGQSINNNSSSSSSTTETPDFPVDFMAPSVNEEFIHSSFQDMLLSLITLNTVSLWMSLLVIISLVYKFIVPSDLKLEWLLKLNKILPEHFVIRIKTILIRIIDLNKKTNVIYIFFILFIIIICNGFSIYFMSEIYNNLSNFCIDHLNFKK